MRCELEAWKEYIGIICILLFDLTHSVWALLTREPVTEKVRKCQCQIEWVWSDRPWEEKIPFCVKGVGRKPLQFSVKAFSGISFCSASLKLNFTGAERPRFPWDTQTGLYGYWWGMQSFLKALFNAFYTLITWHFVLQMPNLSTQILKCISSWVFACTGRRL